jgi:uncharacterized membrane protein
MRRLAPYSGPLITFTVVGTVMAFLVGWLETGRLLAGVATAAVSVVALGAGFALYARVLALGPPSLDRARSGAADVQEQSARAQSDDVPRGRDEGEHL